MTSLPAPSLSRPRTSNAIDLSLCLERVSRIGILVDQSLVRLGGLGLIPRHLVSPRQQGEQRVPGENRVLALELRLQLSDDIPGGIAGAAQLHETQLGRSGGDVISMLAHESLQLLSGAGAVTLVGGDLRQIERGHVGRVTPRVTLAELLK